MGMKCSKVVELLGKYLDKELPEPEAMGIHNHLLTCQSCSRELMFLKRDKDIVKQVFSRNPFNSKLTDAIYGSPVWRSAVVLPRKRPSILVRYAPLWAACAAGLLIATILISLPKPPVRSTEFTVAKMQEGSSLSVARGSRGNRVEISGNSELLNGESVKNLSSAPASFVTLAGSVVTMRSDTSVQLAGSGGTVRITLLSGEIYAEVPLEPLKIVTDEAVVVVKGTKFSVKRQDAVTTVTVVEGEVICLGQGEQVNVAEGFQTIATNEGLSDLAPVNTVSITNWVSGAEQPVQPLTAQPTVAPAQPKPDSTVTPPPEPPVDQPHPIQEKK
jgi:anti-sigma factor RsiW